MNFPYVATPQGFARKIGPKSKYGMNDDTPAYGDGIGPQGAQSSGNARSSFEGQTKVGTPMPKTESRFAASMREAREQTKANNTMERKEQAESAIAESENESKKAKDAMEKSKQEEKNKAKADKEEPALPGVTRRMRRSMRRFAKLPNPPKVDTLPPSVLDTKAGKITF